MTTYRTEYESELNGPLTVESDGQDILGCRFVCDRNFGLTAIRMLETLA